MLVLPTEESPITAILVKASKESLFSGAPFDIVILKIIKIQNHELRKKGSQNSL